jgi:hypothetical protein
LFPVVHHVFPQPRSFCRRRKGKNKKQNGGLAEKAPHRRRKKMGTKNRNTDQARTRNTQQAVRIKRHELLSLAGALDCPPSCSSLLHLYLPSLDFPLDSAAAASFLRVPSVV